MEGSSTIKLRNIDYDYEDEKSAIEMEMTSGTFSGTYYLLMKRQENGELHIGVNGEFSLNIDEIKELGESISKGAKYNGFSVSLDGDDGYDETITFHLNDGKLYLDYDRLVEH
jgi:hypothetical protein